MNLGLETMKFAEIELKDKNQIHFLSNTHIFAGSISLSNELSQIILPITITVVPVSQVSTLQYSYHLED